MDAAPFTLPAVTRPVVLTVATDSLDELHVKVGCVTNATLIASYAVALN